MNLIFYGLGGDLSEWSDAARRCTRVVIEAEVNGMPVTIAREISDAGRQPMEMFGGSYELAQKAPRADWIRYPYQRSEHRESFSQALFRLLALPEARNEISGNITIHQVLRLLYADQLTPIDDLFRFERFDSALLRDAVGRLLCGAYDSRLYDDELLLREREKELEGINGELRSLVTVMARHGEGWTPEWVDAERARIIEEQRTTQAEIEDAERRLFTATGHGSSIARCPGRGLQRSAAAAGRARQLQSSPRCNRAGDGGFGSVHCQPRREALGAR